LNSSFSDKVIKNWQNEKWQTSIVPPQGKAGKSKQKEGTRGIAVLFKEW